MKDYLNLEIKSQINLCGKSYIFGWDNEQNFYFSLYPNVRWRYTGYKVKIPQDHISDTEYWGLIKEQAKFFIACVTDFDSKTK